MRCPVCVGSGEAMKTAGIVTWIARCPFCGGSGQLPDIQPEKEEPGETPS